MEYDKLAISFYYMKKTFSILFVDWIQVNVYDLWIHFKTL